MAIVEGKTEQIFIESLLAPYLALKRVYMTATQVTKSGQKGGDVRFERVKKDIELHLKQRNDIFVTTFVDYYGVREWPGLDRIPAHATPAQIAEIINGATRDAVLALYAKQGAAKGLFHTWQCMNLKPFFSVTVNYLHWSWEFQKRLLTL